MVSRRDARSAAERYVGDLVDNDPNMERERALVEDEYFQSLAVAAEQLDLMDVYENMPRHESTFADAAATKLQLALGERAVTVLDEVFEDADFDPDDYDDVREALLAAPSGYGVEEIIDHFDPAVEGGREVNSDV